MLNKITSAITALLAIMVGVLAFLLQSEKLKATKDKLKRTERARSKEQNINQAMTDGLNKENKIRESVINDSGDLD